MTNTVATDILEEAGRHVGGERDNHGDVENSYAMIAQMWEIYLRHSNYQRHNNSAATSLIITPIDVLEMMSLLKKCRSVYATSPDRENYTDDAGYVALAGFLALPKAPPTYDQDNDFRTISKLRTRVAETSNG